MTTAQGIIMGLDIILKLSTWVNGMIKKAKQDHELTPEEEETIYERQKQLIETADHWKIEPDPE